MKKKLKGVGVRIPVIFIYTCMGKLSNYGDYDMRM